MPGGVDVNVEAAWAQGVTGEGVNVAVVDDGMYFTHEDLKDNVDTSRNHDYTGSGSIYTPLEHHGTHVAGIIAARDNGIGVRGVAPRATVYGYNFLAGARPRPLNRSGCHGPQQGDNRGVQQQLGSPRAGPGLDPVGSFWEQAVKAGLRDGATAARGSSMPLQAAMGMSWETTRTSTSWPTTSALQPYAR